MAHDVEPKHSHSRSEGGERLQKLLAKAGIASRRAAEETIAQGRVSVNGHVVTELGAKADPSVDKINVDGQPLHLPTGPATVVLFHKPTGVVTTKKDPEGRTTVFHCLPDKYRNLHPVGRLDFDTSGVLLLTDDGDLTQLLTHPSHGVDKVYWARVRGTVTIPTIKKLEAGVFLDDGKTSPCHIRVRAQTEKNALVQITLREGRNRQVRRMLDSVGHPVGSLRRVKFGGLGLDEVPAGGFRVLLPGEVHALRKSAEKPKSAIKPRPATPKATRVKKAESPETFGRPAPRSAPKRGGTFDKPAAPRPTAARPDTGRPTVGRPAFDKPAFGKPASRPSAAAPGASAMGGRTPGGAYEKPAPTGKKPPLTQRIDQKFKQEPGQRGGRRQWGEKTRKHG